MEKYIHYYNHLKEYSNLFRDLGKEYIFDNDNPELKNFGKTIYSLYFKGYDGIRYMQDDNNIRYKGYFVESPAGIGVTEFCSLESIEDNIKEKITIAPLYKRIEMLCINKSTDSMVVKDADFLICEKKEEPLFDLYIATEKGLKPLIINANCIEPAEYETEWQFYPNIDKISFNSSCNLKLSHTSTLLKSIKVEKTLSFTKGKYNSVQDDLIRNEHFLWEADFQLAFWEDSESDKYSIKWAIESKIYEKYFSCLNENVCRLGNLKAPDSYICSECMEKDNINVEALISLDKLFNGGYIEEHKEYGDFFTEQVLNLNNPK